MSSEKIIGIDLGTTYSCVAYIDEIGKPVVVQNSDSELTTPSVVYFENENNIIVGKEAKNVSKVYPERVVESIKRKMGDGSYSYSVDGKSYPPEQISSYILRKLIQEASQELGEDITDVVITCPAYFGANEREATKNAGEIAGLNVRHILNEPTAAAIFYGLNRAQGNQTVLVYDLGGGTFDITVITLTNGNIKVVVTGGNYNLGGKDWDELIANFFATEFAQAYPEKSDALNTPDSAQDLLLRAEDAKKSLTKKEKYQTTISAGGENHKIELTREKFEDLTAALLERTIEMTHDVIAEAKEKGVEKLDQIILVGGSSKMPYVAKRIKEEFNLEPQLLDPDLAVAKGAALMGLKIIAGEKIIEEVAAQQGVSKDKVDLEKVDKQVLEKAAENAAINAGRQFRLGSKDLLQMAKQKIEDVCSKGFGVVVKDRATGEKVVAFLIHKNTTLPAESTQEFGTETANQANVEICVMEPLGENESPDLEDNKEIGNGLLTGFPTNLPVDSPIEITFRLEKDGTLKVKGLEPSSKTELFFDVHVIDGVMSRSEVEEMKGLVSKQNIF